MTRRLIALLLVLLMSAGLLAGCAPSVEEDSATPPATDGGNPGNDADTPTPPVSDEVATLQVFSMPSNSSGFQEGYYWTEILKRELGIQIELLPAGDQAEQKLQSLMASKSLPDIVVFKDYTQVANAIEAGLLINLDDYQDKLPNAYANAASAIEYYRDNVSFGTGSCYALANSVTTQSNNSGVAGNGPYLRWDLYKELGSPVLNDLEDYLPVLKQMMDLEPTNEDGQKTYGISIWGDWDSTQMHAATVFQGLYGVEMKGFQEINYNTMEFKSIFEDDSYYKRALKWYFDANQMGILDPDSLTQRWGDYWDKASAGRVLFSNWSWGFGTYATADRDNAGIGYRPVYFTNEKEVSAEGPKFIGDTWSYAISSSTQNLDKALAFVDFMYSYDGMWLMANGDQGVYWDLDENGSPYITELGWDMKLNTKEFPNGGLQGDGLNTINSFGMPWFVKHPVYNARVDAADWVKKDYAPADSALLVDWQNVMGAANDLDYISKHGLDVAPPFAPMEPTPDDIALIVNRVGEVVQPLSWQMVFAANEAEFEAIWAQMAEQARGMDVATADQWFVETYNNALAGGSKYMK